VFLVSSIVKAKPGILGLLAFWVR